jgi:methionyl-tRNA formyltransferase
VAIGTHESAGQLHDRLAALGAEAIVAAVDGWSRGTLAALPQPAEGVTYAAKLNKEEARIDWTRPAVEIDRLVRALNPWPVAEARLGGEQVRVWEAQVWENRGRSPISIGNRGASPGTVLDIPGRVVVATGEGALELLTLQWPGRRPVPARDALHGRPLHGARFDAATVSP